MAAVDDAILHKEIDLIQACITRMAHNSFLIKGWAISIVAVVLALAEKATAPLQLMSIVLIPLLGFWYLDAFFLQTERMYRKMYEWVLEKRRADDDELLYDLNPRRFQSNVASRGKVMWSVTLRWFYGISVILILLTMGFHIAAPLLAGSTSRQSNNAMEISSITVENVTIDVK